MNVRHEIEMLVFLLVYFFLPRFLCRKINYVTNKTADDLLATNRLITSLAIQRVVYFVAGDRRAHRHAGGARRPAIARDHLRSFRRNCAARLNAALRRLGHAKDEITAHGFRAAASSILNESGLWNPDAIEGQLAHVEGNAVRRAYARAEVGKSASE